MKIVNCIIVDDEPLAREIIQNHLSKIPNWKLIESCMNAEEAYEALVKHVIDVVFLDIQMPVISGVEFLQSLRKPPFIIFTTAFSEYALKGFELNALDYLLKPISFGRFSQAIEKVNEKLTIESKEMKLSIKDMSYFFVKHQGKLLKIDFSEILYIKAEQEYSFIFTRNEKLLVSMHLKLLEGILPEKLFTRIHRSYIVSQEIITAIQGNTIQIGDEIQLPIGSKYKENLLMKLNIK